MCHKISQLNPLLLMPLPVPVTHLQEKPFSYPYLNSSLKGFIAAA